MSFGRGKNFLFSRDMPMGDRMFWYALFLWFRFIKAKPDG